MRARRAFVGCCPSPTAASAPDKPQTPPLPRRAASRDALSPGACLATLAAAASECSGCLNGASALVYTRLDRLWDARGSSAVRIDVPRFLKLAVRMIGLNSAR